MDPSDHPNDAPNAVPAMPEVQQPVPGKDLTDTMRVSLALQDLAWLNCKARLNGQGGYAITTTLLEVNSRERCYVFEGCRTSAEQHFLLDSGEIALSAWLRGAPIRFTVKNPRTIRFQGGPACCADFPDHVEFPERRQHPRVLINPAMNYTCTLRTADDRLFEFSIDNLSQTGVGLRSTVIGPRDLPAGSIMKDCNFDFGIHGAFNVSLRAVGHGIIRRQDATYHLTRCTFLSLSASQRTFLQRLIYQIEMTS